jgi:uncharacterized protein (TIGR02145 family)
VRILTDVALTISVSIYDTNGGLISLFYANVPSNTTNFLLPFYISISSNVGSIIINNIQLNGSSTSNYIIGTCQACITKICNQTWMTHNLAVKKYRNGDVIPQVTDPTIWTGLTTGAWCYYNNNPSTEAEYGILYNHYAVTDPRGLALTGYHIPTRAEFTTLSNCLLGDSVSGGKLKEVNNYLTYGLSHWTPPNLGATDQVRFTAIPSGARDGGTGGFQNTGISAYFWNSDTASGGGILRFLGYNVSSFVDGGSYRQSGFSVRLIKD